MQDVNSAERGGSQAGAAAGKAASKADTTAPKAAQPNLNDPKAQEAMAKQKK